MLEVHDYTPTDDSDDDDFPSGLGSSSGGGSPGFDPTTSSLQPWLRIYCLVGDSDATGNLLPSLPHQGRGASWSDASAATSGSSLWCARPPEPFDLWALADPSPVMDHARHECQHVPSNNAGQEASCQEATITEKVPRPNTSLRTASVGPDPAPSCQEANVVGKVPRASGSSTSALVGQDPAPDRVLSSRATPYNATHCTPTTTVSPPCPRPL
jgi:hypothetical protein